MKNRIGLVAFIFVFIPLISLSQNNTEYFEKGKLRLTATDNDGWARLNTYVLKWDDERRDWQYVVNKHYTRNGKADYSLAPGVYKLQMYYTEANPNEMREIEGIQITDKSVIEKTEYFEKGKLRLTATDNDGWARLNTYVLKWDDERRDWQYVVNKHYTRNGKADYSLAPGVYKLQMYYTEANPNEMREIEGIQITDKSVIEKTEYFEKGKLRLTATDNDGWARLNTYVLKWDDERRDWQYVVNKHYTRNGKADYSLAPGVYKLQMYYTEANPNEMREIEGIQITDKSVIEKTEYFEKGKLRLTATDNDGWARLNTYVLKWDDERRDWQYVVNKHYTRNGKADYSLAPGVYKLQMYYTETSPQEQRVIEGIQIIDRQDASFGEQFGGGNMPPIISASGPFEIGDGDNYYEVGEKVLFRININDSDLENVDFLINNKVVRTYNQPGKYEQILNLSLPGEYRFSVRAKDRNGTLNSYSKLIPVNTPRDIPIQSGHFISSENFSSNERNKKCSQCGREYDSGVNYCQHDGNKLNLIEKVAYGFMDAGLIGSGIHPGTKEAQNVKKFAFDWLNPFSTKKQNDENIKRIVNDIIGGQ